MCIENGWALPKQESSLFWFVDLADYSARISYGYTVGGYVFGYDASGANDGSIAYGDAGEDDDSAAYPAATSDLYRESVGAAEVFSVLGIPVWREPVCKFHRVGGSVDLHVGGDQYIVADIDSVTVHKCTIHVDGYICSYMYIPSVITYEWESNRYVVPHTSKQLF